MPNDESMSKASGQQTWRELDALFHPRSVAIVGASTNPEKQGHRYVSHLLEFAFKGPIYPVNPKAKEILGLKVYPSIKEIPPPLDYVISCIPAHEAPSLMEECAAMGVKGVHFFTGRMKESGEEELAKVEEGMVEMARRKSIRVIGPNCIGIYHPKVGLSFRGNLPKETGKVGFISQSGGFASDLCYRGGLRGLRYSKVVSYGNASDLNESDFLEYLAHDPETEVIGAYIEGAKDGRRLFRTLREACKAKPVVILKGGRTSAGSRATASHTASLAGNDEVWNAVIKQTGAVRVYSPNELIDTLLAFFLFPEPRGFTVGILGGGGGNSVFSADESEAAGLTLAPLSEQFLAEVKGITPKTWRMVKNPVDSSVVDPEDAIPQIIEAMARDPSFSVLIIDPGLDWILQRSETQQKAIDSITTMIEARQTSNKPTALVLNTADFHEEWRWQFASRERQRCIEAGIPVYPDHTRAARAINRFLQYHSDQAQNP